MIVTLQVNLARDAPLFKRRSKLTHQYSVEIQDYLTKKMTKLVMQMETAKKQNNHREERYCSGKIHELLEIREFLASKIDLTTQTYF